MKMVLALENRIIPPNINFKTPNPNSNVLFPRGSDDRMILTGISFSSMGQSKTQGADEGHAMAHRPTGESRREQLWYRWIERSCKRTNLMACGCVQELGEP